MRTTEPLDAGIVTDTIYFFPTSSIDPDPDQPRVDADADLSASIKEIGVIQPVTIRPHPSEEDRWYLIDGERRWKGAIAAGVKDLPCRIRLDQEGTVDRLITQLAANAGEPLTAIEEARAYGKIMAADPTITQVELAKRIGKPRSVVGDRVRLLELDKAWLDEMQKGGLLQVSHAPLLLRYKSLPSDYQRKALAELRTALKNRNAEMDPITVEDFQDELMDAFCYADILIPVSEVPDYKGPVLEVSRSYSTAKRRFAADPKIWQPIKKQIDADRERREKKQAERARQKSSAPVSEKPAKKDAWLDSLPAGIPIRKLADHHYQVPDTEFRVIRDGAWQLDHMRWFAPATFMAVVDQSKLTLVRTQYSVDLITTDLSAVASSQRAFRKLVGNKLGFKLDEFRKAVKPHLKHHAVRGPGLRYFLGGQIFESIAMVFSDQSVDQIIESGDERMIETIAAAGAAAVAKGISPPDVSGPSSWSIVDSLRKTPIAFPDPDKPRKAADIDAQSVKAAIEKDASVVEEDELAGVGS